MPDREKAIKGLEEIKEYIREKVNDLGSRKCRMLDKVDDAVAMLKERQGKGHWIEYPECLEYDGAIDDTYIACSECGHVFCIMDNCTEEFDFCPHCGADMREGAEDNQ